MRQRAHADSARTEAEPRRLLVVAHLDPKKRGSLEQQFVALADRLRAIGVSTTFVFARQPTEAVARELAATGATVETADFSRPLAAAWRVAQIVRRVRPDVVHLHFLRVVAPVVAAARATGAPVVMNDHMALTVEAGAPRDVKARSRQLAKRALVGLAGTQVARRVAVSQLVARTVAEAERFPVEKLRVVENGIDLRRFVDAANDPAGARRALGLAIPDGAPVIGCVARMAHEKGVDVAIEALARLPPRHPAHLLIAGDGPLRRECEEQAHRLGLDGRVHFLGLRSDVERVVAASDHVWVPSRNEAFGLAAAEAMAAGRPVVASRAGALPEVVDDGVTGLLFAAGDADALADAATALLDDRALHERMAAAAAATARRRFGLDRFADALLDLYRDLAPHWFRS